jgi:uncharacterized protein YecE (DUF72 family)
MTKQFPLFSPADSPHPVGVAEAAKKTRSLAERLPDSLYLGTSSWSLPGWEGIVYDRNVGKSLLAQHGLVTYGRHPLFRTVCIDRTYYGPTPANEFHAYAESVPEYFRFVVKAHELVTSVRTRDRFVSTDNECFLDPNYALEQVVGPCLEGLGTKASVLLFQFPPQVVGSDFAERLHRLLDALPQKLLYAVELRNRELLTKSYLEALEDVKACHCFNIHPTMPTIPEQVALAGTSRFPGLIVRWMLGPNHGYEDARAACYPFDKLAEEDAKARAAIAELCRNELAAAKRAFVIVNNKAEGCAPLSLVRLAGELHRPQS